jgi:pilus assembly protein CpaE
MSESATILLVSKNESILEATRTTFARESELNLLEREVNTSNLNAVIEETQPDVILVDFDFSPQPFNLVDKIVSSYSRSAVIAILPETGNVNLDRVVLAGARAFIHYPFPPEKLAISVKRVIQLLERNQSQSGQVSEAEVKRNQTNIFTVFSPKGGAGSTTIATNLAITLHQTLKEDVLLIDGKHLFGHVALYLNLRTGNSLTDLIAHAGMLDKQLINQVVIKHNSGIHVLPSPNSISEAQGIRPENLFTVIQSLQEHFPHIVIDAGNNLNENTVTYMDASDKILLVLNPDLASMRDVRQFIEISSTLSYPKEKILLILNQAGRKADVKLEEIEQILKMKIFGKIPADENFALACLNEGVPIVVKKSRHSISKAFKDIAKDLQKALQPPKGR